MSEEILEIELVFYAKLTDTRALKDALSVERHEQYSVKLVNDKKEKTSLRVRKVTKGKDNVSFECTSKVRDNAYPLVVKEDTVPCDHALFELIKSHSSKGMKKDRYRFLLLTLHDVPIYADVDAFTDPETNTYYPWVKIDIEFPSNQNKVALPSDLTDVQFPFSYSELLSEEREEDQDKISDLYDHYFKLS